MIAIRKTAGRYAPVVVCDHCVGVIDDAMAAAAVSSSAPEGATAQAHHVHKGSCDEALTNQLGGALGSEELAVHLFDLVRNTLSRSDAQRVRNLLDWSDEQP
jgi:hypothetical protein